MEEIKPQKTSNGTTTTTYRGIVLSGKAPERELPSSVRPADDSGRHPLVVVEVLPQLANGAERVVVVVQALVPVACAVHPLSEGGPGLREQYRLKMKNVV